MKLTKMIKKYNFMMTENLTSADSSRSVFQNNNLINFPILVEYRPNLTLIKVFWYLTNE